MPEAYYTVRFPETYQQDDPVLTLRRFNRLQVGEEAYIEFRKQQTPSADPHFSGTLRVHVSPYESTLQGGSVVTTVEGELVGCEEVGGYVKLVFYPATRSFLLFPQ